MATRDAGTRDVTRFTNLNSLSESLKMWFTEVKRQVIMGLHIQVRACHGSSIVGGVN